MGLRPLCFFKLLQCVFIRQNLTSMDVEFWHRHRRILKMTCSSIFLNVLNFFMPTESDTHRPRHHRHHTGADYMVLFGAINIHSLITRIWVDIIVMGMLGGSRRHNPLPVWAINPYSADIFLYKPCMKTKKLNGICFINASFWRHISTVLVTTS